MMIPVTCPSCQKTLRVREDYAGKKVKCPVCLGVMEVPANIEEPVMLEPAASAARPEPEFMAPRSESLARPRRSTAGYLACPKCRCTDVEKVRWTPWGSFFGPALFNHVRCTECGYAYNGKTGGSNLIPAIFFVVIPLILIGLIGWFIFDLLQEKGWIGGD